MTQYHLIASAALFTGAAVIMGLKVAWLEYRVTKLEDRLDDQD